MENDDFELRALNLIKVSMAAFDVFKDIHTATLTNDTFDSMSSNLQTLEALKDKVHKSNYNSTQRRTLILLLDDSIATYNHILLYLNG